MRGIKRKLARFRTVRFSVTETDIERGKPEASTCPIAIALKRALGEKFHIYVSDDLIRATDGVVLQRETHRRLARFVEAFDAWKSSLESAKYAPSCSPAVERPRNVKPFRATIRFLQIPGWQIPN
jgi:hypothetical protein